MPFNCNNQKNIFLRTEPDFLFASLVAGILLMVVRPYISVAQATNQATYNTADSAVYALEKALAQDDTDALLSIFGKKFENKLMGDDTKSRERASQILKEKKDLHDAGANKKILYTGNKSWPFPVPLVKTTSGWYFDTEAGIEELVNRRIGRNELYAIEMCLFYSEAQIKYANTDRDSDEVLEYAQLIASTPDKKDGLFWKEQKGAELSPFGPLVADANGYLDNHEPGDPYEGYYYKIITHQGSDAIGGRYDYIINGSMIAGFALLAFPADYR